MVIERSGTGFMGKWKDMYQFNQILSEAKIRTYIRRIVFGKNIYCPMCKSDHVYATQGRYPCRRYRIIGLDFHCISCVAIQYEIAIPTALDDFVVLDDISSGETDHEVY